MKKLFIALAIALPLTANAAQMNNQHLEELRKYVYGRINDSRMENGVGPVEYSKNIEIVAQGHANDLATHFDPTSTETREATYLAHTSSDGRSLNARYRDSGVDTGWQFAENVGYWIRDPFDDPVAGTDRATIDAGLFGTSLMHEGMMAEVPPNDSHRKNILGNYTHVGIGLALLNPEGSDMNAIFMVTDFSRYQSEEEERRYRENMNLNAATSPRSLQGAISRTSESTFPDVNANDPSAAAINTLKNRGIINGYPDGTFRPEETVSRAELVKMLMDAIGLSPIGMEFNACFSDVFNQWFAPYVCVAKRKGWITGYADGSFSPGKTVNRAEAITIASRIIDIQPSADNPALFDDVPPNTWFSYPLNALASNRLLPFLNGKKFLPDRGMKRKEVAVVAYEIMQNTRKNGKATGVARE